MDDYKAGCGCILIGTIVYNVIFWILAFTTYDAKSAFLVMLVLNLFVVLASFTGLVPLVGPYIYWKVSKNLVFANFFIWFPEIDPTWLTTFIFWEGFALSIIFTLSITGIIIGAISNA